jgi:hypothetical protein
MVYTRPIEPAPLCRLSIRGRSARGLADSNPAAGTNKATDGKGGLRVALLCIVTRRTQLWQSSKDAQPSVEFGEILAQEWRKFNIIPLDESATT